MFSDFVAQLVEQYTFNVWVLGSNPNRITIYPSVGIGRQSGLRNRGCNGLRVRVSPWVQKKNVVSFNYRVVEESGLSRFVWDEEHAGSNPAYPTHW